MVFVPKLADTITKIDLDPTLVNKNVIHTLVCHNAMVLRLKFNEGEL